MFEQFSSNHSTFQATSVQNKINLEKNMKENKTPLSNNNESGCNERRLLTDDYLVSELKVLLVGFGLVEGLKVALSM